MTIKLRITGKNADGEYWLHFDGSPQRAGLNLGDPDGMITSALLMAASGHTYIRADAPELVALVAAMRKMREGWANALELGLIPERHRTSAQILHDDAADTIAAWEAMK